MRVTDWTRRPVDDALVTLGRIDEGGAPTVEVEGRTDAEGVVVLCARGDADAEVDAWDDDGQWAHASGNDALEDEDRWLGEAEVTPIAGRITDVEVRLERPTSPRVAPRRGEGEGAREWCTPSMMLGAGPGETMIVLSSGPDDMPLRPGDRILTVNGVIATPDTWDAIDGELTGPEGSTTRVEALRPDGQRITADITRTPC